MNFGKSLINNTKEWIEKASIRAIKTAMQTFLSCAILLITGNIGWKALGFVVLMSTIFSLLTSVWGIPEVSNTPKKEKDDSEDEGEFSLGDCDIQNFLETATALIDSTSGLIRSIKSVGKSGKDDDFDEDEDIDDEDSEDEPDHLD